MTIGSEIATKSKKIQQIKKKLEENKLEFKLLSNEINNSNNILLGGTREKIKKTKEEAKISEALENVINYLNNFKEKTEDKNILERVKFAKKALLKKLKTLH